MKRLSLCIVALFIMSEFCFASTTTTNLGLTKPDRGESGWADMLNDNFDTLDTYVGGNNSAIDDLPEVERHADTFNSTTGVVINLSKTVDSVNEYGVKITPDTRAGAIGDIWVVKGVSSFTVYCSEANTTDTFEATVFHTGDMTSYGGSMYRRWYVSPSTGITDHSVAATVGSLAYVLAQMGGSVGIIELPANRTYTLTANSVTIPAGTILLPQPDAVISVGSGRTLTINGVLADGMSQCFSGAGSVVFGSTSGTINCVRPEWWDDDIEAALESIGSTGGKIQLSADTYEYTPTTTVWLPVPSDTTIEGVGPHSIVKVADSTGNYPALFGPTGGVFTTACSNITFKNFSIDQNISNGVGTVAVAATQYHNAIYFTPSNGSDFTVEKVVFDSACGVNVISLNSSSLSDVKIINNTFNFTMQSPAAYDTSTIYLHCTDATVVGNTLEAIKSDGANAAIEVHTGPAVVYNNVVKNYITGINIVSESSADTAQVNNMTVNGNAISGTNNGIYMWALTSRSLENVSVNDNVIQIDQVTHDEVTTTGIGMFYDVGADVRGDYKQVKIEDNNIQFTVEGGAGRAGMTSPSSCAGIYLRPYGDIYGLTVNNNTIKNAPGLGITIGNSAQTNDVYETVIKNNTIIDAGNNIHSAVNNYRVFLMAAAVAGSTFRNVEITGNQLIETNATLRADSAIDTFDGGTITDCVIDRNTIYSVNGSMLIDIAGGFTRAQAEISSPETITSKDCYKNITKIYTNVGASGSVEYDLPVATPGMRVGFSRQATQTMLIDPNGTNVIRGGGAGKYMSLDSDGAFVVFECIIANIWEVTKDFGTITYEP